MEQVFTNRPDREVMTCALLCLEVHGDYIVTKKDGSYRMEEKREKEEKDLHGMSWWREEEIGRENVG